MAYDTQVAEGVRDEREGTPSADAPPWERGSWTALGRNTQHVLAVVDHLTTRGIGFRSLIEGLHTEGPMRRAMFTIMKAFAQLERDTTIERTALNAPFQTTALNCWSIRRHPLFARDTLTLVSDRPV